MSAAEAIAPEQSVDEVRQSLSVTDKGKTANTIDNCRIVFCCDPLLRDAIRLNLLTDRVDIVQDLGWRRNTSALTDTDVKYLLLYFERNYELTSEKKITAALSIVANENCYHPIQDVLNSLVWDGTPRIRSCLHHFLGADESDYVEEMLKHFLLGAIRRVFRPGSKYEEMLCLVGGQGAGKSTFFRLLAIRDEWFSDDLKKLDDDRVFQKLQGHWIIEMSEMLATSSAKSIEEIRSFISRQKETYRTPYESQPKDRLRQCVFGGSSNTLDFLPLDRAGNRRFLPIMIYPENAEVHILEDEDCFQSLSFAGVGRSYEYLPQRTIFIIQDPPPRGGGGDKKNHEIQQVHPASNWGRYRKTLQEEEEKPDRYRVSGTLHREYGLLQNSCLRRRWDTPLMSRSGGSSTISMRS